MYFTPPRSSRGLDGSGGAAHSEHNPLGWVRRPPAAKEAT